MAKNFQSTPSSRRATQAAKLWPTPRAFQSTPSSRRATFTWRTSQCINNISIHALLTEGDAMEANRHMTAKGFQSTPSSRRATAG